MSNDTRGIDRAAALAAEWWSKRLNVTGGANAPNIDAMASIMKQPVSEAQQEKFRESLQRLLVTSLTEAGFKCWVETDYNPDRVLDLALTEAGIGGVYPLPFKRSMLIETTHIEVKDGYGQPWERIDY